MLFRRCVSQNAAGKDRAVLEGVGLSSEVIEMCYRDYKEEEAVQSGLNRWRGGNGTSPTWAVLLDAMDYAELSVQHISVLKGGGPQRYSPQSAGQLSAPMAL